MPITKVPDKDHVIRHCKNRLVIRDEHGNPKDVFPDFFKLRVNRPGLDDEKYLSSSWAEYFDGSMKERAKLVAEVMSSATFKIKAKDSMVLLQVEKLKDCGLKEKTDIRVTHEPNKTNPAYSAIRGVPKKVNQRLVELFRTTAVIEIFAYSTLS